METPRLILSMQVAALEFKRGPKRSRALSRLLKQFLPPIRLLYRGVLTLIQYGEGFSVACPESRIRVAPSRKLACATLHDCYASRRMLGPRNRSLLLKRTK